MTSEPYMPLPPAVNDSRPVPGACANCGYPLDGELCRRCAGAWLRDNLCWRCGSPVEDGACIEAGHMVYAKRDPAE